MIWQLYVNRLKQCKKICNRCLTKTVVIPVFNGNIHNVIYSSLFLSDVCNRNVIIALIDNTLICKLEERKIQRTLSHLYKVHNIRLNVAVDVIKTVDAVVTDKREVIINLFLYRLHQVYKTHSIVNCLYLDDIDKLPLQDLYKYKHFDIYPFVFISLEAMYKYLGISMVARKNKTVTTLYQSLTYPILFNIRKKQFESVLYKLQILSPSSLISLLPT